MYIEVFHIIFYSAATLERHAAGTGHDIPTLHSIQADCWPVMVVETQNTHFDKPPTHLQ